MLELVTVRSRTRGKTPQLFTFRGVGKITSREVMSDKQEQAKDEQGNLLFEDKERTQPKMVAAPVRDASGNAVMVDDIDPAGITNDLTDVVNVYKSIYPDATEEQLRQYLIDGSLNWFNVLQRKAASPVVEQDKEDELTPIINVLVTAGLLKADDVAVWRRNITSGAKLMEVKREEYAKMTPTWKAYAKTQAA